MQTGFTSIRGSGWDPSHLSHSDGFNCLLACGHGTSCSALFLSLPLFLTMTLVIDLGQPGNPNALLVSGLLILETDKSPYAKLGHHRFWELELKHIISGTSISPLSITC